MIGSRTKTWLAWLAVLVLTLGMIGVNVRQSLERYRELDTGWSWDLAYYNQWFWSLTRGDGIISVRPQSMYGGESPSIWRANYLTPIRLLIAPFYAIRPGPETLLVVEAALLWMVVPAAFVLARGESGSTGVGLAASGLVCLTPLLVPIAANDFRELQLAIPFAALAVEGVRGRHRGLATLGIGGLLACRQEYAPMVASLAILGPRVAEDLGKTARWACATWFVGVGWTLLFLLYLAATRSVDAPRLYLLQFAGEKAPLDQTLATLADLLLVGLGAWGLTLLAGGRAAILVFPWAWSLASGRWSLRFLAAEEWHHVRYAGPFVAIGVAVGVLGFARLARRLGRIGAIGGLVLLTLVGLLAARGEVVARFAKAPRPISTSEAAALWPWFDRVGPGDGVIADYSVTAPLSSRRLLRSYRLLPDQPPGYPRLGREFQWVFARAGDVAPTTWTDQGFELVHSGETISIFHRDRPDLPPTPAERPIRRFDRHWFEIDDINRLLWIGPGLALVAWPWVRLRRAWRSASSRDDSGGELTRVSIVSESPRDLADPLGGVVRLAPRTATSADLASRTLARFEEAHLAIAREGRFLARVARWRPSLLLAARLGTVAGLLAAGSGLASGCRLLLELGMVDFLAAAASPLLLFALEREAARRAEGDPALLESLRWRHLAEAVPVPWKGRPSGTGYAG